MLGAITGDVIGSAYEFKNLRSKAFEPLFHPEAGFTDDTVCTVGIADALIRGSDPASTLQTWCQRYAENGGWGQRFALWIFEDPPQPYGSWGNGAAMRISPVGFLASTEEEAVQWADAATIFTHNHPEAVDSARAVALAIFWSRNKMETTQIAANLTQRFGYDLSPRVRHQMTQVVDSYRARFKLATTKGSTGRLESVF